MSEDVRLDAPKKGATVRWHMDAPTMTLVAVILQIMGLLYFGAVWKTQEEDRTSRVEEILTKHESQIAALDSARQRDEADFIKTAAKIDSVLEIARRLDSAAIGHERQ